MNLTFMDPCIMTGFFTKMTGTLHEDRSIFFILSFPIIRRMINVSDKSCRENQNTNFTSNNFSFRKLCRL
jgi:hypothetical protein